MSDFTNDKPKKTFLENLNDLLLNKDNEILIEKVNNNNDKELIERKKYYDMNHGIKTPRPYSGFYKLDINNPFAIPAIGLGTLNQAMKLEKLEFERRACKD